MFLHTQCLNDDLNSKESWMVLDGSVRCKPTTNLSPASVSVCQTIVCISANCIHQFLMYSSSQQFWRISHLLRLSWWWTWHCRCWWARCRGASPPQGGCPAAPPPGLALLTRPPQEPPPSSPRRLLHLHPWKRPAGLWTGRLWRLQARQLTTSRGRASERGRATEWKQFTLDLHPLDKDLSD